MAVGYVCTAGKNKSVCSSDDARCLAVIHQAMPTRSLQTSCWQSLSFRKDRAQSIASTSISTPVYWISMAALARLDNSAARSGTTHFISSAHYTEAVISRNASTRSTNPMLLDDSLSFGNPKKNSRQYKTTVKVSSSPFFFFFLTCQINKLMGRVAVYGCRAYVISIGYVPGMQPQHPRWRTTTSRVHASAAAILRGYKQTRQPTDNTFPLGAAAFEMRSYFENTGPKIRVTPSCWHSLSACF